MPDTAAYLFLGLGVTFGMLVVYIASLITRSRSLDKDAQVIEQIKQEE